MARVRCRSWARLPLLLCLGMPAVPAAVAAAPSELAAAGPVLSPRNLEAPFPYVRGGRRDWPIVERAVPPGTRIDLVARVGDREVAGGAPLEFQGLSIELAESGRLLVRAEPTAPPLDVQLEITLVPPNGVEERQTLELRPAPPDRPISYYADLGDDLIRIFMDPTSGGFGPVTKTGFDQFFRRLQAHGVRRLIVWPSPFPFITDPANYAADDWRRYERQARAILDDAALTRALEARAGFKTWSWLRFLLALRLRSDVGRWLGASAVEHGVALTASYRPFEAALTKYYEVPAFDHDGTYLWGFLPLASPTINYRAAEVGWRHYREVLREVGRPEAAELAAIELPGVTDPASFAGNQDLRITAASFPPLADDSFVLVRDARGEFLLRPFAAVRSQAEARCPRLVDVRLEPMPDGLRVAVPALPADARYLVLSWEGAGPGPDLAALLPVVLRSQAGRRLGRETTYWVAGGPDDPTRVAGITCDGGYRAEFQACELSQRAAAAGPARLSLAGRRLVIDLGAAFTVEMIDFNQPLARRNAVRELATLLAQPGFDEVLVNTRSHVDLPPSMADGDRGTRPAGAYWHEGAGLRIHLGLDKAYAPCSETSLRLLRDLVAEPGGVERITTWQPDEWRGSCQDASGPPWRYARNRATADGVRALLDDLAEAFPETRVRLLVPPRAEAVRRIEAGLETLERPDGGRFGSGFIGQLWPGANHVPAVGEGLAMLDLGGLAVEPAFLGSGGSLADPSPLELYVRECVADMADNRGSRFRGPRSYFLEAQSSLRASDMAAARAAREAMIRRLLSCRGDISEVILYESADWLYLVPLADADLCGHGFLDRRPE